MKNIIIIILFIINIMDKMEEYVSNIEELTLNISNENDFLKKILIINKLKKITNNLNIVTNPREYFGTVNIQNINIQLLDEYGRVIDLNNMDYSFCLTLITAYDI